jgi:aminoglycoside/choline kinase family phosphotransferase
VYDLVALLGDSYQTFQSSFVSDRLREFAVRRGLEPQLSRLEREFRLVMVQRKLKDAGRFVFIERSKGDRSFLKYIAPTLELVQASLAALRDDDALEPLRSGLARWQPQILAGL